MTTRNAPAKGSSLEVLRARAEELGVDFKGYYYGFTGTPLMEATAMTAKKTTTRKRATTKKAAPRKRATAKKAAPRKRATTKKAAPRKRATAKTAAPKTNGAAPSLGRAGTMGHAMREGIVNGVERDELLTRVREQFPKHNIGDYYYAWYRRDCEKRGLIEKS